jgi:hypothetical protein
MAVRRADLCTSQFHPESVLTEHGYHMLDHFLLASPDTAGAAPVADRVTPATDSAPLTSAPPPVDLVR